MIQVGSRTIPAGTNGVTPEPNLPAPPSNPPRRSATRATWQVLANLQFALVALTIAMFIITFVVQAFRIPSGSMENTLLVGDYLLVDKTRFAPSGSWQPILPYPKIHQGDIVVFRYPVDPAQHFVKRVIGLPGDRIHLSHAHLYVNGREIAEPYVVFKEHYPDEFRDNFPHGSPVNENITADWARRLRILVHNGELIVPPGQYFVLGDNRDQSLDSRYWGLVPRENIIGRPMVIYFSIVQPEDDDEDDPPVAGPWMLNFLLYVPASCMCSAMCAGDGLCAWRLDAGRIRTGISWRKK